MLVFILFILCYELENRNDSLVVEMANLLNGGERREIWGKLCLIIYYLLVLLNSLKQNAQLGNSSYNLIVQQQIRIMN